MDFEISFDFIVFETERLLLREFNADDVDAVYAYAGDAENTIYIDGSATYTLKHAPKDEVKNIYALNGDGTLGTERLAW